MDVEVANDERWRVLMDALPVALPCAEGRDSMHEVSSGNEVL